MKHIMKYISSTSTSKMIAKRTFLVLLFSVLASLNACKKLDQTSPDYVPEDQVFSNTQTLKDGLNGLYASMTAQYYYGGYYPLLVDLDSDNGVAGLADDNQTIRDFGSHKIASTNAWLASIYVTIYNSINAANHILVATNTLNAQPNSTSNDIATNNIIKGETLALRAMAHFDLLRMFGYHWDLSSEYGIPVVLTVQKNTDVVGRATVSQTYDAIIKDLKDAETLLTNSTEVKTANYVSLPVVQALLARVYLYKKDKVNAALYATKVIDNAQYSLATTANFKYIYSTKLSTESIFELGFTIQTPSAYNILTYVRDEPSNTEVAFIASADLQNFFANRTGDQRIDLLDYSLADFTDAGDGRTLKYRGEKTKDNPAYIFRIAEMYLIRAEANQDFNDINTLRANRGYTDMLTSYTDDALLDERRAELNFEGHRFFDLARLGKVQSVLGADVLPVMPIPYREVNVANGKIKQNPGY